MPESSLLEEVQTRKILAEMLIATRVFGSNQVDSNMWEIPTNQFIDQLKGTTNKDYGACDMHLEEQGRHQIQVAKSSKEPILDQ